MRQIDKAAIGEYGISGAVLMERAGSAVASKIREIFKKEKIIVLCGGGNNGGDGLVAARNLFNWGWNAKALIFSRQNKLSADCAFQYKIAKKTGVPIEFRTAIDSKDLHSAIVVDALFGTGLNKAVAPPVSDVIAFLNRSSCRVVSVDIPSGISADTGEVLGEAVRADFTVTFGLSKRGHVLYPGADCTGKLFVEDIGFPRELLESDNIAVQTIERDYAIALIPERQADSYKSDYGHVLVVAGSIGKTGAAMMTAKACLRSGAGMVTMGVPESLADIFQARITEEMILPLPDTGEGILSEEAYTAIRDFLNKRGDVLAIGPGLTSGAGIRNLVERLLMTITVPAVLDADAINSLSGNTAILKETKSPVVLTPHPGEMARLLESGQDITKGAQGKEGMIEQIKKERIKIGGDFAKETGSCLVLKGVPTVVAEPGGKIFLNTIGNPGMATAGSGDVLTGMIAAFLGQGLNPAEASILGVYMHALSGDIAAAKKGVHALIAGDIIDHIPDTFLSLL